MKETLLIKALQRTAVRWNAEVEINKKGIIENYIIDGRAWEPGRFRGNKPMYINSICMEPLKDVLPARGTIEDDLYNIMVSIRNIIKKLEDREE